MAAAAASSSGGGAEAVQTYEVPAREELRFEVPGSRGSRCLLRLLRGTAEIFGSEVGAQHAYSFGPGEKVAVFSWSGATLSIEGDAAHPYVAGETPMPQYMGRHSTLEGLRRKAQEEGADGRAPVVMVVGPSDAGKSSLCKMLVNYAVRHGWTPTLVDLDVGQNEVTVPGTVAAVPVEKPLLVTREFGLNTRAPISFFYGHSSPRVNDAIYREAVENLAAAVARRSAASERVAHSGVVINTCGWVEDAGYELVVHAAGAFHVDVVFVMGQERLWSKLKADERMGDVFVDKLPKSGGVVERSTTDRQAARAARVHEYFYGVDGQLRPHQSTVPFKSLKIFKTASGHAAPDAALPLGGARQIDHNKYQLVDPTPELNNCVLGVSFAKSEAELRTSNLAGFVHVVKVDPARRTVTLLAPSPGQLPGPYLLVGSVKFFDNT